MTSPTEHIHQVFAKIGYISRLIVATPRYGWIILLQFMSGAASIIGLPMLIPVLDSMAGRSPAEGSSVFFNIHGLLSSIGLPSSFLTILMIATTFILIGQGLVFLSALVANNAQADLANEYKKDLFDSYSKANWLWVLNNRTGEMNYSILQEADQASVAHLNAQRVVIYSIQVMIMLLITLKLSVRITLLALSVYFILGVFGLWNASRIQRLAGGYNEKNKWLANELNSFQQNKKLFKTSLLNTKLLKGIFAQIENITTNVKEQNLLMEGQNIFNLAATLAFLVVTIALFQQTLSYSTLLLILIIFTRISPQFAMLSSAYATLDRNIPAYNSLHQRLREFKSNAEKNGTETFSAQEKIRFENVEFIFPNGNKVFERLNATIEPKKNTAFVGRSGSGKSTLLDLLLRLLDPTSGTINYGLIPHHRLDKKSIRGKVAYVSQETSLISGTLRENLLIRAPETSDSKLADVLRKVGLDDVIAHLSQGLESPVGENGIKLSGGQRQRVALARALFMDPEILILDEATNALDSESELLIQQTIKNLQKELTIIMVTHKFSAVRCADVIYVLEDGGICESGTYDELIKQKGKFHSLNLLQE